MNIYDRIPNNVNLAEDPRLQRALEKWLPNYLDWWREMGPAGFQEKEVYLRTAISVEPDGWAHYDYVKMPDYRWGIFLTPPEPEAKIGFGDNCGKPAYQEVPGEFRNPLRRIIVTQGDTEPASVEQQRQLGRACPSLYDLRNLFQVNVEEGRHLWAMVYLLHGYFGRDGREEAEELLRRRSGDLDKPRILQAFNQPCDDWLNFYCFTMFTDRDGKYQLCALAESGFEPLARACKFMLTEEAYHMFVGEAGVGRIVRRSAQLMKESRNGDAREFGGVPLDVIQKHINFWYSYSLDLFGGEISSNSADFFAAGLKGRYRERELFEDHVAADGVLNIEVVENHQVKSREAPLRNTLNEVLRGEYAKDCERGLARWNKILADEGVAERLYLPSRRFHRRVGEYAKHCFDINGALIQRDEFERRAPEWLPTAQDREYVLSLMTPVTERRKIANWIAPPAAGTNHQPFDFEYVRL
ncbi:MAG: benzoyl-CoA 2,3-epoxidase subunit BoxB [Blastocatellia bacterium]|nr:benzoyl-CoA 2,3-epoxidase subunit BoxB [Blastocatellia bacterium]